MKKLKKKTPKKKLQKGKPSPNSKGKPTRYFQCISGLNIWTGEGMWFVSPVGVPSIGSSNKMDTTSQEYGLEQDMMNVIVAHNALVATFLREEISPSLRENWLKKMEPLFSKTWSWQREKSSKGKTMKKK